jgi:ATP-binding protein involved in chromosome partitioning
VPVLGLIENMSYYACSDCGKVAHIFRKGGGEKMSAELNVPLLGEIPIDPEIAETGDAGLPIVAAKPDSQSAKIYHLIASAVAAQLSIVNMKEANSAPAIDIKWQH